MRKIIMTVTALILILALVSGACAKPAPAPLPAPAPAPAPKPTPAPKPAPALKPGPAPKADALAKIIEGAKKEGTVFVTLTAAYTAIEHVEALEKAVKDKYGVDLDIKMTGARGMAAMLAKAIMEYQTGTVPTYDVMIFGTDYTPGGVQAGVFEMVDWKPLLPADAPPKVQFSHPMLSAGLIIYGLPLLLQYNPEKISAAEAPKKISDLADPKWKGRLGMQHYSSYWARWAFMNGKDNTLSYLRSIIKNNEPVLDRMPNLNKAYLLGEIDMAFISGGYMEQNMSAGKPTAARALDVLPVQDYQLVVIKGARHPNAAKLLTVFFASPEGARHTIKQVKYGHSLYPGNVTYDQVVKAKKEGVPVHTLETYPGLLDFVLSPDYAKWQKEIKLIIDAGKRN